MIATLHKEGSYDPKRQIQDGHLLLKRPHRIRRIYMRVYDMDLAAVFYIYTNFSGLSFP